MLVVGYVFVFFFKQKTAYEMRISDWSSDVCSSDLVGRSGTEELLGRGARLGGLRRTARLFLGVGPELGGHHLLELELLFRSEREQLIGGLLRLQRTLGALAPRDNVCERRHVVVDVLDHLRLDRPGMATSVHPHCEASPHS